MKRFRLQTLFACLPIVLGSGCGRPVEEARPAPASAPDQPPGPPYKLVGVVRVIDRNSGFVTIRHEAIEGFMPAMTMPFRLDKDDTVFDDLQPGDEVEGRLNVVDDRTELTGLFITRPAEPTDPSTGSATSGAPELAAGELVPDFVMTTQEGKPARLSDWSGRFLALTFIYTRCPLPDYCPLLDRKFAELARAAARTEYAGPGLELLSVSFDPEHDTPEVLAVHARRLKAQPPRWTFATATHDELSHVAGPLGLAYGPRKDEIVHTLSTAIIGPDRRLITLYHGNQWSSEDVLALVEHQSGNPAPTPSETSQDSKIPKK